MPAPNPPRPSILMGGVTGCPIASEVHTGQYHAGMAPAAPAATSPDAVPGSGGIAVPGGAGTIG